MNAARTYLHNQIRIRHILLIAASLFAMALSSGSFAAAAPKVSTDPVNFSLVSLSPSSGSWNTKVTITTDVSSVAKGKQQKSYKVNVGSSQTATVATSTDGGRTYTFTLETFCPEVGPCPAVWPVSGDLAISLRDSSGNATNSLIFTLVE